MRPRRNEDKEIVPSSEPEEAGISKVLGRVYLRPDGRFKRPCNSPAKQRKAERQAEADLVDDSMDLSKDGGDDDRSTAPSNAAQTDLPQQPNVQPMRPFDLRPCLWSQAAVYSEHRSESRDNSS